MGLQAYHHLFKFLTMFSFTDMTHICLINNWDLPSRFNIFQSSTCQFIYKFNFDICWNKLGFILESISRAYFINSYF